MIKAVLFDFDGTLINTNELIIKCFKYVYKEYLNLEVTTENICKYFGEPLLTTMKRYDEARAEELTNYYKEYNAKIHDEMVVGFEGVRETLVSLRKMGIKVGVVTSKRKEMTLRGLKLINIEDTIDVVITPEDTKLHKPNPEPLLAGCDILKISPSEVLYVGDTSFDLKCSKAAKTKSGLVKYTMLPIEELLRLQPDYVIEKLYDIVDIVKNENEKNIA